MLYKSPLNVQLVIHVSDVQVRTPHSPWQRRHHSLTTERRYTVGWFYLPGIIALRLPMQCNPSSQCRKNFPFSCTTSRLKNGRGGFCALVPATSDRETSVDELLLDHLPSANLLVLVDWCLPGFVGGNVGQRLVQILKLLGLEELFGLRLEFQGCEEAVHGRCRRDRVVAYAHAGQLLHALDNL